MALGGRGSPYRSERGGAFSFAGFDGSTAWVCGAKLAERIEAIRSNGYRCLTRIRTAMMTNLTTMRGDAGSLMVLLPMSPIIIFFELGG
jgi:hypothetical protein